MIKKLFVGTFGLGLNIAIYIVIALFAIRIVTYAYGFSYEVFGNTVMDETSEEIIPIQINEGASTKEVGDLLEKRDLIKYSEAFVLHTQLTKYKGAIKPGNYELSPSMNMDEILGIITGMADEATENY